MDSSTPFQLKVGSAAARVLCNRITLGEFSKSKPVLHVVQLAYGMVLSQPLRPAMPDPNPHPLRFGWYFESLPLTDEQIASVKLRSPGSLVRESAKESESGNEDDPDQALQGLPEPQGLLEGREVPQGEVTP